MCRHSLAECLGFHSMQAEITILGSGTSMGVPTLGCDCRVCTSSDPRDRRTRPSIAIRWASHCVLVDTGPDFRQQALREGVNHVDAVLYTHSHADHILGLDDLRPLSFKTQKQDSALCGRCCGERDRAHLRLHLRRKLLLSHTRAGGNAPAGRIGCRLMERPSTVSLSLMAKSRSPAFASATPRISRT